MSVLDALIIEDDRMVANIYAEALRLAAYEPMIIGNGRDALTHLENNTPDLILLDLHLPEVQGADILERMQAEDRFGQTLIFITTADPLLGEQFREQVDLVLLKPISFTQLRDLTQRLRPG